MSRVETFDSTAVASGPVQTEPVNLDDVATDGVHSWVAIVENDLDSPVSVTVQLTTEDDEAFEKYVTDAELGVGDGFAISDYNLHLYQEIDATSSGLELRAGSFGFIVFGNIQETTRTKASRLTGLSYGGSGEYEPVAACRVDPDRGNVYSQFKRVTVFPSSGSGELLVNVFSPEETDASGFDTPAQHNPRNSVIEETTSVTTFTNESGTEVSTATDPGGYQVGFTQFDSAGTGNNTRTATSQSVENKRPLYEDNTAVFLYKADTASSTTLSLSYLVEQDW